MLKTVGHKTTHKKDLWLEILWKTVNLLIWRGIRDNRRFINKPDSWTMIWQTWSPFRDIFALSLKGTYLRFSEGFYLIVDGFARYALLKNWPIADQYEFLKPFKPSTLRTRARNVLQRITSCKLNIWAISRDVINHGNITTLFQSRCQTLGRIHDRRKNKR